MNQRTQRVMSMVLVVASAWLTVAQRSSATVFEDSFTTTPFGSTSPPVAPRWCERFHHVHWDSAAANPMMFGINGDCCEGLNFCGGCTLITGVAGSCNNNCTPLGTDSAAPGCKNLLISSNDYIGADRQATIAFGLPLGTDPGNPPCTNPTPAVSVATAAHPHCETAFEARIIPQGGGVFGLEIRSVTTPLAGYTECGSGSPVIESSTITAAAKFTPVLTTTPRYELSLATFPNAVLPSTKIAAVAEVFDRVTSTRVAVAVKTDFNRPSWYDQQARRFAFGGSFPLGTYPVAYDEFSGETVVVSAGDDPVVPPAPEDNTYANGAKPIDPTVVTDFRSATKFLYDPQNGAVATIQTAYGNPLGYISASAIDQRLAAVVRGRVLNVSGTGLSGVRVSILGAEAKYGQTRTRVDGKFDLAVNGGGPVTVVYDKPGYLTVHRQVQTRWQDFATAPDVVMIEKDPNVTLVDLAGIASVAVARGSAIGDDDGAGPAGPRRATMLFTPGTTATGVRPNGTVVPFPQIRVRATEYTIEPNGPAKMPAELPRNSAFTYAVELGVDEADDVGATRVDFSSPVIFYLENFLPFPFAQPEIVPAGYYDRQTAKWIRSEEGKMVQITGKTMDSPPLAEVDTDGVGGADNLGISTQEREALARTEVYGAGPFPKVLWRVPIAHFSPWDYNWPDGPPGGAAGCDCGGPINGGPSKGPQTCDEGSEIGCERQTLGESIDLVGTPYRLHYQTDRVLGRAADRSLRIPLKGSNPPGLTGLLRIEVEVLVAGQRFADSVSIDQVTPVLPEAPYEFTWDGKDAYGRYVQGRVPAVVRVGYTYRTEYGRVARFADYPTAIITGNQARREVTFWENFETWLESWDARGWGLGGWTFDVHHFYDPGSRVLLYGDGRRQADDIATPIVETFAGGGTNLMGSGIPATQAQLTLVSAVAADADGTVYVGEARRIRKVDPFGNISLLAGKFSTEGFNGDGPGSATSLTIGDPMAIALAPDGSLYFADSGHSRIRRIYSEGANTMMVTVAGSTPCPPAGCVGGYGGDGGPATAALLNGPNGVALGPDGSIYIADTGNHCVRRVGTDGIIRTIAGACTVSGTSGDGGFAASARLVTPQSVAVDRDGIIYVLVGGGLGDARVRRITPDGKIDTVAGLEGLSQVNPPDGSLAKATRLFQPHRMSVQPTGDILVSDRNTGAAGPRLLRRISSDGFITTIAGDGTTGSLGDGGPARLANFQDIYATATGPDGSIYMAVGGKVRRLRPMLPEQRTGTAEILLPSRDGAEVYVFDSTGRHLRTHDALTAATILTFGYDGDGRLMTITDRNGNHTMITNPTYSAFPSVGNGSITAWSGQQSNFVLGSASPETGYLKSLTNPASETSSFKYGVDGLLTEMTDPRIKTSKYTYDGLGRLATDADPEILAANPSGYFKALARADDTFRKYTVTLTTAMARLSTYAVEVLASGKTRHVATKPDGTQAEMVVGLGDEHESTSADGTKATWVRRPEVGRFGMQAALATDLSITTPLMRFAVPPQAATMTQTRTVSLAAPGQLLHLSTLDEAFTFNGRSSTRSYHPPTRTLTDTTAQGRKRFTILDSLGRVGSVQVEGFEAMRFEYDSPRGRLERIRQGSGGAERVYTLAYDPQNRLASVTNPMPVPLQITSFGYDAADRVTTQTLPDTNQVGFGYDANGNLTSLTPPGRPAHGFSYTATNLESTYAPPMPTPALVAPQTLYTYNPDRQLDLVTRPHVGPTPLPPDVRMDYVYESGTDRLSKIVLPTGEGEIAFSYDAMTGQLVKVTGPDPAGATNPRTTSFTYDGFLGLSTTWGCQTPPSPCPAGTVSGTVSREYDTSFRVTTQKVNGANAVNFGYDNDDLLTSVTLGGSTLSITRDTTTQKGGLITATALGGVTDTRIYNAFGELDSLTFVYNTTTPLYSVQYPNRDHLGRITQKLETIARPGGGTDSYTTTYSYDSVGRLATVNVTGDATYSATYAYDANGNRTAAPNLTGMAIHDPQDRLLQYGTGGPTYDYTANGELATKTTASEVTDYDYDAVGNLRSVVITPATGPVTTIEYLVDGLGRRIGRKENGALQQGFLYDDQLRIVAELDGTNTLVSRFAYADQINVPEFMAKGGQTYRLITDHLGSVRLVVNVATGTIAQRIDYDEFGTTVANTLPGFQPLSFTGGILDDATKLQKLGARDYDPFIGRWTTKDQIRFAGGTGNLYEYVLGDPVNYIDPSGLYIGCVFGFLFCPTCAKTSLACAPLHADPLECAKRGEPLPEASQSAHIYQECWLRNVSCSKLCIRIVSSCPMAGLKRR